MCIFSYFQVETRYHQTYTYLVNSVNLRKEELKSSDAAFQLIDEIERHVVETKQSQFNDLLRLAQLSHQVFGDDRTQKIYDDNIFIYQSFEKVKSDIVELVRDFKVKEDAVRRSRSVDIEKNVLVIESSEDYTMQENIHDIIPVVENNPPKFLNYLESSEVKEGESFVFECQVVGLPTPDIKWLKYNSPICENSNYKINFVNGNCRLEILNVSSSDAAVFSCVASNLAGTSQTTANLIVIEEPKQQLLQEPPRFIRNLQNGYANEKSSFEFNCIVEGSPLPSLQWFKNDICVDNYPNFNITYNNGAASLVIPNVSLTDQGVFSARASNEVGFIECSAILSVEGRKIYMKVIFTIFSLH
jgi:hypothetical protein